MTRTLTARIERFPVRGSFVIARGAKTHVDVAVAEISAGAFTGRGEATAIYYRGESAETVVAAIAAQADAVAAGASRADLLGLMPAGAARNALDAALWDFEAKASGQRVWQMLGLPRPQPLLTAFTISLGDPASMAAAAALARGRELLKIKLGGVGGTLAEIERVARLAQAHDFVTAMPEGYATRIGERGAGLSGGQRQRIAIARAMLLDPKILILDDSMSAVDAETERLLQDAIATVMQGRTTILVAHRLATAQHADHIIVLRNGQIVEQGTHAALDAAGGHYHHVLEMQQMSARETMAA